MNEIAPVTATMADLEALRGKDVHEILPQGRKAKQQAEAQEHAAQLSNQVGQLAQEQQTTKSRLSNVATDVSGVKSEVKSTQAELNATKAELKRVVGDLGVQSDLIARTGTDLADLRARGERDYVEFDIDKKAKRKKVGNVSIELKKTDDKKQKFTIALTADDKTVEKKDRNPFEPVQFYLQGQRQTSEIVVQKVLKDRIVGYVSAPKKGRTQVSANTPAATTPASGS